MKRDLRRRRVAIHCLLQRWVHAQGFDGGLQMNKSTMFSPGLAGPLSDGPNEQKRSLGSCVGVEGGVNSNSSGSAVHEDDKQAHAHCDILSGSYAFNDHIQADLCERRARDGHEGRIFMQRVSLSRFVVCFPARHQMLKKSCKTQWIPKHAWSTALCDARSAI